MEKLNFTTKVFALIVFGGTAIVSFGEMIGCKGMTPQEDITLANALGKTSATLLCAAEEVELADLGLDKMCEEILPNLTPSQQAALRPRLEARKAKRTAMKAKDAGCEGGAQ